MESKQVGLVSGSSRGIGAAIAKKFAQQGIDLMLVARSEKELSAVASTISRSYQVRVSYLSGDLQNESICERAIEKTIEEFGQIDILVNCAGTIHRAPTLEHQLHEWDEVMRTNVTSAFMLSRLAISQMLHQKQGGSIVNISSQMAGIPHLGASPSYESSKAALNALTRHLAAEYADKNIRVNSVSPGSIETALNKNMDPLHWKSIQEKIPMKRLGQPYEVAEAVNFLASKKASYITGNNLYVAGGSVMH
ncbi:SDR family oxidoreductase [Alphaproteobacteria bacterium]|nr:SDR family oxidoreductase [Alphaproteobacteria bacterium]